MVTQQETDQTSAFFGGQVSKCESKLPAGALCEGSCKAKDLDDDGFFSYAEEQTLCSCGTYANLAAAQARTGLAPVPATVLYDHAAAANPIGLRAGRVHREQRLQLVQLDGQQEPGLPQGLPRYPCVALHSRILQQKIHALSCET
jgi:hypothetical protein